MSFDSEKLLIIRMKSAMRMPPSIRLKATLGFTGFR
jgi:hypothetical protein